MGIVLKRTLLLMLTCLGFSTTYGQFNYYKLSASAGLGLNTAFTGLSKKKPLQTFAGGLDYYLTPYTSIGIEYQNGSLGGGDKNGITDKRFFKNDYEAVSLGAKVQLGQLIKMDQRSPLYRLRGVYGGLGIGMIRNAMSDGSILRVEPGTGYVYPGRNKSRDMIVPVNAGINLPLADRWRRTRLMFNLNYQFNITSDGLDGYTSSLKSASSPDMYGVASVGLKVCFGRIDVY